MSKLRKVFRATALAVAVVTALALAPVADAAGFSGFHGGGGFTGGFHGGGSGFHRSAVRASGGEFRNDGMNQTAVFRGEHRDWHRYGHWRNGVWIGIWPGDYADAYWNYYCDPASPYFDPDYCGDD